MFTHYASQLRAACVGIMLVCTSAASAGPIDLGFLMDSSGSVGTVNWALQSEGFSQTIEALPRNGEYRVTFVSFASHADVIVEPTLIDSDATLASVQQAVADAPFLGSWTNTPAAIRLFMDTISSVGYQPDDHQLVNLATDGDPMLWFRDLKDETRTAVATQ
ncbi:MAG: hypothetical protein CMD83_03655 [Gammaproteobacteria bacterium]|nr:hypothetical protein [Gammaproteobacteria bacterium]